MRGLRGSVRSRLWIVLLGSALVAPLAATVPAHAANPQVVTSTADDGSPGTLRNALTDVDPGGIITFDSTVFPPNPVIPTTITLTSEQLTIAKNLTIQGPGAGALAVKGPNTGSGCTPSCFRVFLVNGGVTVTISGLEIRDGQESGGAGISNFGDLDVTNSKISDNVVVNGYRGAGIFNAGTLDVTNSTISGNLAFGGGFGGGISNLGVSATATITNSIISGNQALQGADGGGISNEEGTATVTNSSISSNFVDVAGAGGGIFNTGTLSVTKSTISGNTAASSAGGIQNSPGGNATVVNSTISGNGGSSFDGNAIRSAGTVTVTNSTIASNSGGGLLRGTGISTSACAVA